MKQLRHGANSRANTADSMETKTTVLSACLPKVSANCQGVPYLAMGLNSRNSVGPLIYM